MRTCPRIVSRFDTMLITCLDSTREIDTLRIARGMVARYPACTVVSSGLLVPTSLLSDIDHAMGLFTGFDEVWCFRDGSPSVKPKRVSVLPPPGFDSSAIPADVLEFMLKSNCMLALGDGFGMNYVTPDHNIARELQEFFPP